ncbi:MAG: hypothetical protein ABI333_29665 [bacterium]
MTTKLARALLILAALCWCGCGSSGGNDPDAGGDAGGGDGGADAGLGCTVGLPQAVEGALWANPEVYPVIPLHIEVAGQAVLVDVATGATPVYAQDNGDGTWTADVSIAAMADGTYPVEVTATCGDGATATASAELGIGTEGVQLTFFDDVGTATTPRIHRRGAELWVTWVARYDGLREAWMQRIDGAGRWIGDRIPLTDNAEDTFYARTALGADAVGVLYQEPGQPYDNMLRLVDYDGNEVLAPRELNPPGWVGRPRGDITHDGSGFIAVYRVGEATGISEIHWLRVDEQTLEVTGPVVVAESGDGTPIGSFDPYGYIKVAALDDVSLVSFMRGRYDPNLDIEVPKAQLTLVQADGTVALAEYAGVMTDFTFHWETRVSRIGDELVAYWALDDLMDPSNDPPTLFYGTRTDGAGLLDPGRGRGELMLSAPFDRADPFLLAHPWHPAVLAWTDLRSYELDPLNGRIELFVAPVDEALAVGEHVVFPHARFFMGSSQLNAVLAGSNVLLLWKDERHGNGLMDPRPEVWFETAWY